MILKKQEKEYKEALSLNKERNKLYNQRYKIPSIKLDKPIQHGFVRTVVIRDEVKRRPDYALIKEAYNLCGVHSVYHPTKDFIIKRKKSTEEKHSYLRTIRDPRFKFYYSEEKRATDIENIEKLRKYLRPCNVWWNCDCAEHTKSRKLEKDFVCHYYFANQWMLEEITKEHYLTHYKPIDASLESRISEIDRIMEHHQYNKLLWPKYGDRRDDIRDWIEFKFSEKQVYHALDADFESLSWE